MTEWTPDVLAGDGLVVYTAIFGDIADQLRPISVPANVRAICFTNRLLPARHNGWETRYAGPGADPRRTARFYKACPHLHLPHDTRASVWLDGAYQLVTSPLAIIADAAKGSSFLATFQHPQRRTWLQEARACIAMAKDDAQAIKRQIDRYLKAGLSPGMQLLAETGIVVRHHAAPSLKPFGELWYGEILRGSARDQISFPYVCKTLGVVFTRLPGRGHENAYARYFGHATKKPRVTRK